MDKKFYNAKGELTDYSLSCGYMQLAENENERVRLYKESNVYHVIHFDIINGKRLWLSFDVLTLARKQYNQWKKFIKQGVRTCKA